MEPLNSEKERLQQFAVDVQTLWRIWEKSITVTVSGYIFTVSSEHRVRIQRRSGDGGIQDLGELQSYPSGYNETQWSLTSQSM